MKLNKNINIVSLVLLLAVFFEACKTDKIAPLPNPVATTGVVTTIAGSGSFGAANGKRTAASFNYPNGLAIDASGNVYIADKGNNQIRKIVGDSVVSTISGTLLAGSTNATKIGDVASFNGPTGVAVDAAANIYVADFGNQTIRKIATTGAVTVFAGVSGQTGNNDTTITAAVKTPVPPRFNNPAGLAIDATGNLYVADYTNNSIRKITADGKTVSTIAGKSLGNTDGVGTKASFNGPRAIAIDATGNLYVADANNHLIRKIDLTGTVTTIAGTGKAGNSDGTGTAASFSHPSGITIDNAGNLFVADAGNNLIRKITPAGVVSSVAGSGYYNLITPFNGPSAVVADNAGNIYVANTLGNLIQKIATK
ncbi:NHL repeat-containing protein [Mucilaginibacter sp. SP1R1]|uniref:NHL repeat-containing protein n=1 Tax=Mucilaginibacter sp. SP1R1 TaxID=2723091 RepID=UPI00160E2A0D|nr:NHL repeat-containing protein [Mucilaginibacter sp. SP1R1]MBB6148081.1 sugar lactone lactonase YvrE [Mucilaginibacter sp. SP1R1]